MHIKFLGAAGTVTGSSYLLTGSKGTKLLIDFGMFQGPREISDLNSDKLQFDPSTLSAVLLTHAHLDHCGRLPILSKNRLNCDVYMTPPTRQLSELTLLDTAKISKEDRREKALFAEEDVHSLLGHAKIINYHEPFTVNEFKINYIDAGHILGSASIEIIDTVENKKIAFSGDLGNTPEPISSPTEYIESADYVVMESTYGGRTHPKEDAVGILQSEINTVESFGSTLLLPAFSLERTQVILHMIDHLKKEGKVKPQTPIYLDSPMGIKATYIYGSFPNLYGKELKEHVGKDDPFDFPGLTLVNKAKESQKIANTRGAKVIIAGSGMMSGGRILNHALTYLPDPKSRLLIIGYQAEGTIGRYILEGAREVKVYGKRVNVNAKIREITSLSAHADEPKLINWLSKIKGIRNLFLTHGDDEARELLKNKINSSNMGISQIHLPKLHEEVELA